MEYCIKKQAKGRLISTALIVALSISWCISLNKNEVLQEELYTTQSKLIEATTSTKNITSSLTAAETKLQASQDPIEYKTTKVPTYDLPLSVELQAYTYDICNEYGIVDSYELVLAMMWKESHFKPDTISKTNDYGIMQINKINHEWLSERLGITNFLDAKQSIKAGVYIISTLLNKYHNEHKALMAYNLGESGARRYWKRGTYTSSYSSAVVLRKGLVLQNKYSEGI